MIAVALVLYVTLGLCMIACQIASAKWFMNVNSHAKSVRAQKAFMAFVATFMAFSVAIVLFD